jgi:DNA-binding CsgD family transcriptional regulator
VRTEAALWGGRPQRAAELAEEILDGPEGDANLAFARVSRAWALFDLGREPGPPVTGSYPAMLAAVPEETTGICLLSAGSAAAAVDAFDGASVTWGGYHRRGEIRCEWAAGEAARRAGGSDAVDRLERVEQRAGELGMVPLLSRIHRSLRAAGVRRTAAARRTGGRRITDREREVLDLVGAGLTNAEIAGRLGVSRHTVISQIASASAKLGARSRTHAASLVAGARAG